MTRRRHRCLAHRAAEWWRGRGRGRLQGWQDCRLELTDEGAGYRDSDKVKVAIAPPPKSDNRRKSNGMYGRLTAAGKALLEFEVGSVSLASAGVGYGSSQNLDLRFFSGNKSAPSKAPESFATPSPAELAERPWSIENIAGLYGDRVSARSTSDVLVLRPPSATLVLGATRNAPRPRTSPPGAGRAASTAAAAAGARRAARQWSNRPALGVAPAVGRRANL